MSAWSVDDGEDSRCAMHARTLAMTTFAMRGEDSP